MIYVGFDAGASQQQWNGVEIETRIATVYPSKFTKKSVICFIF